MRYFIHLAYRGTDYCGWQRQPNGITVQEVLEKELSKVLHKPVGVSGAGRTDAGVHARNFYAHFDAEIADTEQLKWSLNSLLPADISVFRIFPVKDDVHARFSAVERCYAYQITKVKDPFRSDMAWLSNRDYSVETMNRAASLLIGKRSFACFEKSNTQNMTDICDVREAFWEQEGSLLIFRIRADRFLRNMVRSIVGTLLETGLGKLTDEDLARILESGDRRLAGESVPAHGLFLEDVRYPAGVVPGNF